ncbi:hypothetical protein HYH02_010662, partial [Chlamydomonas schloesseri]
MDPNPFFVLPTNLLPSSAYMDGTSGLDVAARTWRSGTTPPFTMQLRGSCLYDTSPADGGYGSLRLDGSSCYAILQNETVPNWSNANTAPFTLVIIYKRQPTANIVTLVSLSRTPTDFDRQLHYNSDFYLFSRGYAYRYKPGDVTGRWVMDAFVRDGGGTTGAFYRSPSPSAASLALLSAFTSQPATAVDGDSLV